jgi:protein O-GlcNAc transferase
MSYLTPQQLYQAALEHHRAGRVEEAQRAYRQLLMLEPRHSDALHMLGIIEQQAGHHQRGFELIRAAIEIDASPAEFHYNLGNSLLHLNRIADAAEAFAAAVARNPHLFEARRNLGAALMLDGRANEAAEVFAAALRPRPDAADVHNNLGLALRDVGDIERAVGSFARAIDLAPAYPAAWDNYLYALHYHPGYDAAAIAREHAKWAGAMTQPLRPPQGVAFANDRSADRKLRVGYASPNFREHPVGRALLPLLENHDRARFEVICYSDAEGHTGDAVAQRLRRCADRWQPTAAMDDARFAAQVRDDRIDLLIDTTLHMTGSRLLAFARRAAPVQLSFIGYPATTGLPEMDYRITDPWLDPPGSESDRNNVEKLVRLTRTFWCYDTADDLPVGGVPALARDGQITFGSLNSAAKVTAPVLDTWAQILTQVPSSRMILFANERMNPGEHLRCEFVHRGVAGDRLTFLPRVPRRQYLQQYGQIDIALDPWPYNGHMTTCDALWMGVPVVSLVGQASVARAGLSLLSAVGLEELLARSREQYLQIAVQLASDKDRLAPLRRSMRERVKSSPLADAKSFAREVESIYRELWRRWCDEGKATTEA